MSKEEKPQTKRDSRTHDQRVSDLESEFGKLKIEAIAKGKKTIASAAEVLKAARVNRTYFYNKGKLKDATALAKYHVVRDSVQTFQKDFDSYCEDTVVNKLKKEKAEADEGRRQVCLELTNQEKQIVSLHETVGVLKQKVRLQSDHMFDVVNSASRVSKSESGIFSEAIVISPDRHLWKNGQYHFNDIAVREKAWELSREELNEALRRSLPSRVYLLVGPPCAGKTTWAKDYSNIFPEMHSVIIDATNLSYTSRLEWISLINKHRAKTTIKICVVVFLVAITTLKARNNRREPSKRMDEEFLLNKAESLEFPNLRVEDFDEMIVVRGE
ncbi:hypothetical protein ACRWQN_04465 [Shewanella sp. HL-SH8]|uniref:hypothetical protein n=1 Tax=Shewanella sp. HL-SH8 TaxID=3436242 RepID=UPI003EBE99AC